MSKLYLNISPPHNLMISVGRIASLWQMIELEIELAIWGLAEVSGDQGRAITAHMTFPLRCDVLRALYHAEFKDTRADKALSKLIEKKLKPAQGIRNLYIHALWLKNEKGDTVFLEKDARGKPNVHPKILSETTCTDHVITILAAYFQIRTFFMGSEDYHGAVDVVFEDIESESAEQAAQADLISAEQYLRPTKPNKLQPQPLSSRA